VIDLHTHSVLSDGELLPSELVRRFEAAGYRALAITDHVDPSNLEVIIPQIVTFCDEMEGSGEIRVLPGVELTHVPPALIPRLVNRSRALGAKLVVVHGETIVEPVRAGTNRAAIEASVDILAHPGLITEEEVILAKDHSVLLELTSRKGHSLTNGHVARLAQKTGAALVLNSDAHAPGDIWPVDLFREVALGAGVSEADVTTIFENARNLIERCLG